jgi:glucose-6-phosphate 1-dehydrogenase
MPEQDDDIFAIQVEGKNYSIDMNELEVGEIEIIENAVDKPMEEIDFRRATALRALLYVVIRRNDPNFTMDDAQSLKWRTIEDPPEEQPEAKANGKPKSKSRPTAAAKSG